MKINHPEKAEEIDERIKEIVMEEKFSTVSTKNPEKIFFMNG